MNRLGIENDVKNSYVAAERSLRRSSSNVGRICIAASNQPVVRKTKHVR